MVSPRMPERIVSRLLSIASTVVLLVASQHPAQADLNCYCLFSVEWLVDESSVIVVARFPNEQNEFYKTDGTVPSKPEYIRALKGNISDLTWPLALAKDSNPHSNSYRYLSPDNTGHIRLLFIRGRSELLEMVRLGRPRTSELSLNYYGVTQYGELLQSESSLYRAIDQRVQIDRKPIADSFDEIDVPHDFLLQSHSEYYSLRVPVDEGRRDHFLQLLSGGDAAEKVYSIRQLARMNDLRAHAAIREALHCDDATPVYKPTSDALNPTEWDAASVREAAATAIDLIENKHQAEEVK